MDEFGVKRGQEHATNQKRKVQDKEDKKRARNMETYPNNLILSKPYPILS